MGEPTDPAATPEPTAAAPVTSYRLHQVFNSARYWSDALPRYADREQRWADWFAIGSALIGAITGLSIWPLLESSDDVNAKVVISIGAIVAAMLAAFPRVMSYAEMAGQARELASRYADVQGLLSDVVRLTDEDLEQPASQAAAAAAVAAFQAAKAKKDALRRLPDRERDEILRKAELNELRRRTNAQEQAALAKMSARRF